MRIAEDGEVLFDIERERPGGRWILFESLGEKQIGDSVELSDTDLQHQRHGLVIRGGEAAGAVRIDEGDHAAARRRQELGGQL